MCWTPDVQEELLPKNFPTVGVTHLGLVEVSLNMLCETENLLVSGISGMES